MTAPTWKIVYDKNDSRRSAGRCRLDPDGNLVLRLREHKGRYRFRFEANRGTFDPDIMFMKVYGVTVGPTVRFWRVPGNADLTKKTRALNGQMVCPMLDVYRDNVFFGSAITEFPSHQELREGRHFGEFSLPLDGGEHEIKLVNGRDYRLKLLNLAMRKDERVPQQSIALKHNLRGKHPRLFFTATSLNDLRARAGRESNARWRKLRDLVNARKAAFQEGNEPDWLDVLPFALMHLMTGRRSYLETALKGMQVLLTRNLPGPAEGQRLYETGKLEPGTIIETAACFYDWCHPSLDPLWQAVIRESLARVMNWWMTFIKFNSLEWPGNPGGMGHSAYNYHAVGLAGLALLGEVPEAQEWLDWAARHFAIAAKRMARDGSMGLTSHEHCFRAFLNFAVALNHAAGINPLDTFPFFHNLPDGRIRRESAAMEMFPTDGPLDYPPDFIAWEMLATLTRNPEAQWLADRYLAKSMTKGKLVTERALGLSRQNAVWQFLHYDPTVPSAIDFSRKPLDRLHKVTGLVLFRSGWLERDAVMAALHTGVNSGPRVQELERRVSWAGPPAANMVAVYGYGEQLIGNAIQSYRQSTADYCTLTVEGEGQLEEGTVFGNCAKRLDQNGRVVAYRSGRRIGYAAIEAAQCYLPEAGLEQFTRHLCFLKPDVIVVFDEVALAHPRGAEIHYIFCDRAPAIFEQSTTRTHLRFIQRGRVHFAGRQAGLLLAVPAAMRHNIKHSECRLARNYTDSDSRYSRISVIAPPARVHRFLSLLLPLPDTTLRCAPEITETADMRNICLTLRRGARETNIVLPLTKGPIDHAGIRFEGKLLIFESMEGKGAILCAVGATRLHIHGWRPIASVNPRLVFREYPARNHFPRLA